MNIERRSLDYDDPEAMHGDLCPIAHEPDVADEEAIKAYRASGRTCGWCGHRHAEIAIRTRAGQVEVRCTQCQISGK